MVWGTRSFNAASQGLSDNPYPKSNKFIFFQLTYISLRSILIFPSHLYLGLPRGLFLVGFYNKILKTLLPSSILATVSAHLNLFDLIILIVLAERYKLWISSLYSHLHFQFSSLLGPDIRLRNLFSNTLSPNSSFNIKNHVPQPYGTTGNIIVLYFFNFKILREKPRRRIYLDCITTLISCFNSSS